METHKRSFSRFVFALASVLLMTTTTSCDRQPSEPEREPSLRASNAPVDPEIDPTDSYAIADISLEASADIASDTAMADPYSTGGDLTNEIAATAPEESMTMEVGFSPEGQPVSISRFSVDPDDPEAIATLKVVGGEIKEYNSAGQLIVPSAAEVAQEGPSPLTELAVPSDVSLVDGLVLSSRTDPSCLTEEAWAGPGCPGYEEPICDPTHLCEPIGAASRNRPVMLATRVIREDESSVWLITDDLTTVSSAASPGERDAVPTQRRIKRHYTKNNDRWMLAEVDLEQQSGNAKKGVKHASRVRFRRVRYHENKARDLARKKTYAARQGHPPSMLRLAPERVRPAAIANEVYRGPPSCPQIVAPNAGGGFGTENLVLAHGIWSDSCTWERMDPWIRNKFFFKGLVRINTDATAAFDLQADSLQKAMRSNAGFGASPKFIMIGHSNGGVISRRVGQRYGLAKAVITIQSPNSGAPGMRFPLGTASRVFNAMTAPLMFWCYRGVRGCGEVLIYGPDNPAGLFGFENNLGLYGQMIPGSFFLDNLNRGAQPFLGYSIVGQIRKQYKTAVMRADFKCAPEQTLQRDGCRGGREQYHATGRAVKHYQHMMVLTVSLSFSSALRLDWSNAKDLALRAVQQGGWLVMVAVGEFLYDKYISPGDESDGAVPVQSQDFRTRINREFILNSDSHVGATRSSYVRDRIFKILTELQVSQ